MAEKRADADDFKHPALVVIEKRGLTRSEAAKLLGVPDKVVQLNHVLDRWRGTSDTWKQRFHEVFDIPLEALIGIPIRPPPKVFVRQQRAISRKKAKGK